MLLRHFFGHDIGHPLKRDFDAFDRTRAFGNRAGHGFDMAVH